MIDLNRYAPLTNPKLVGQTAQEAEQFRTTSNNFANNQVSSTTREFVSPDDDYECCPNCGRKFFSGRLQLHLKSCKEGKPLKPIKGKTVPRKGSTPTNEAGLGASRVNETTPRESQREKTVPDQEDEEFEPNFGNQRKSQNLVNVKSQVKKAQEYEEYEARESNRKMQDSDNEEEREEAQEKSPYGENMGENENPVGDEERVPCGVCGRNFHPDRVEKHEKACKKSNKKRQVFDMSKQRMVPEQGELVPKGVSKMKKAPVQKEKEKPALEATGGGEEQGEQTKKVPAWKAQHENFIKNIKFNRKLKDMEARGEDTSNLVAPTMANDDYVPCPHCSRKFAPATAERHIPKCKNTFNRPKPPKALKLEKPEEPGQRNERIDRSKTQFILRKTTTSNPNKRSPEKGELTPTMSGQGVNKSPQSAFSTGNYDRNMEDLMKDKGTPTDGTRYGNLGGQKVALKKTNSMEYAGKQAVLDLKRQEMLENMNVAHEIKMPERKNRDLRSQSPGGKEEKRVFMEAMPKKEELLKNYQGVAARSSTYSTETCPHCQRNFAKHAAERHIPVCKSMASRIPKKNPEADALGMTKGKAFMATKMAFRNRSGEREEAGAGRLGQTGTHANYEQLPGQEKVRQNEKPPLPAKKSLGDTDVHSAEKPPLKPKMFSTGSNFCTSCGCKSLKTHKFCGNCGLKKAI